MAKVHASVNIVGGEIALRAMRWRTGESGTVSAPDTHPAADPGLPAQPGTRAMMMSIRVIELDECIDDQCHLKYWERVLPHHRRSLAA